MMWNPDSKKVHDRPLEIWFNDGYVAEPENPEPPFLNGTWGPLDLIYPTRSPIFTKWVSHIRGFSKGDGGPPSLVEESIGVRILKTR